MKDYFNCFTIGLTGGIASGKSAVSNIFESLGVSVIDTDIISREIVEPNSKGLKQLVQAFGESILTSNIELDRAKLRNVVFNDSEKLSVLNSILHPLIQQSVISKIKLVKNSYCIIVIPLLCENATSYNWLNRVLVVDVMPQIQLKRLMQRDAITQELATKMIQSQCTRKQRLSIATDVINNELPLIELQKQTETLNCLYKSF